MSTILVQDAVDKINSITKQYEQRRLKEILGSQSKSGRHDSAAVPGLIGQANAARELRSMLLNEFGTATAEY